METDFAGSNSLWSPVSGAREASDLAWLRLTALRGDGLGIQIPFSPARHLHCSLWLTEWLCLLLSELFFQSLNFQGLDFTLISKVEHVIPWSESIPYFWPQFRDESGNEAR